MNDPLTTIYATVLGEPVTFKGGQWESTSKDAEGVLFGLNAETYVDHHISAIEAVTSTLRKLDWPHTIDHIDLVKPEPVTEGRIS